VDLVGKQVTQVQKTALGTLPVYDTYLQKFSQCAISFDGGADAAAVVKGFDIKLDNGFDPNVTLGAVTTRQPVRRGKAQISGNIRMIWAGGTSQAKAIWDKYKSNAAATVTLTVTGPANATWTLTLSNVRFTSTTLNPEEGQLQMADFGFVSIHDSANTAFKLACLSTVAAI
jgi:hypothetical protein